MDYKKMKKDELIDLLKTKQREIDDWIVAIQKEREGNLKLSDKIFWYGFAWFLTIMIAIVGWIL